MSPSNEATLVLPARLDATTAPALYRDWQPRAGQLAVIDMAGLASIDSAGVALVQQLRADAAAARGTPPVLHNPPPGYLQVCRAHRLAADGD